MRGPVGPSSCSTAVPAEVLRVWTSAAAVARERDPTAPHRRDRIATAPPRPHRHRTAATAAWPTSAKSAYWGEICLFGGTWLLGRNLPVWRYYATVWRYYALPGHLFQLGPEFVDVFAGDGFYGNDDLFVFGYAGFVAAREGCE